jgi:predicted aldo/keto reductase-like oxidoreductase
VRAIAAARGEPTHRLAAAIDAGFLIGLVQIDRCKPALVNPSRGGGVFYKRLGRLDVFISILALGGHEYLPSGLSRGFNENFELAIRPGNIFEGFGQESRKQVLSTAFEHGINFFDVTMDSEKEALGRNLQEIKPPYEIYVQTRPESSGFNYDKNNVFSKFDQYEPLKAEVQRILKLIQRERIDFLNLPFMKVALDKDPEYINKIRCNIQALKKEGLIRFAVADTFSGEFTYLKQIEADCFDAVFINFNFGDYRGKEKVLPRAREKGMGVFARETFMKGKLFRIAEETQFNDSNRLALAALRWTLAHDEVTTVVYGTHKANELLNALRVLKSLEFNDENRTILEQIKRSNMFKEFEAQKTHEFLES